jgi:hypothetical protein
MFQNFPLQLIDFNKCKDFECLSKNLYILTYGEIERKTYLHH